MSQENRDALYGCLVDLAMFITEVIGLFAVWNVMAPERPMPWWAAAVTVVVFHCLASHLKGRAPC